MAEKPIQTPEEITKDTPLEILISNPDELAINTEDGGMVIDFDPESEDLSNEFNDNLAEYMDASALDEMASELTGYYLGDKESRKDWEDTYIKGLDQLGLKIEERSEPWDGACGVFHPLLTEAVVRFQAQAITEVFPPKGPVRTQVVGELTLDKEQQAGRVKDYLNYLLTDKMAEYRSETEKLLFNLPLAGSAFRKVYYDHTMGRPCSMFVPAEDFVISYGASDLTTCERATHVMKKTSNDIRKLQVNGFYRDVELSSPSNSLGEIQEKYNQLTGDSANYDYDQRHTLLEMMVNLDLEDFPDMQDGEPTGIALPYIVTIEMSSRTILSIRRNWYEDDDQKMSRQHFVHYQYLPGLGFYGFGLIHLIGGIAKSATSLLRQLVDAGTLSNLPGGLKSRGLRIKGDDTPIMPGEFRDVDVPGGAIRDNITFLPYKEPSGVLYQLLDNLVEEGRRFASVADMKVADMNNQAPVGTTLAILERSMKVMGSVQARIHASMKKELKILANIVKDFGPTEYPYEVEGQELLPEDFDDRIDVIPVSDPNASTTAQRIMQYQAALQLAQQAPQMYNMAELHRQMLEVLGIRDPDSIVPLEDDIPPTNPVSENMNILNETPVKAFMYQDHEAHIMTHMAMADDPKIKALIGQSPNANAILGAFSEHVTEHVGFQYRKEIEKQLGTSLPPIEEPLPEDIEVRLSKLVAEAAQRVLNKDLAEERQKEIQEKLEDPVMQQRDRELDIKESEVQRKMKSDAEKIALDLEKSKVIAATELERLASQERIVGAQIGVDILTDKAEISSKEKIAGAKLGKDIAQDLLNTKKNNK
jgi:hypothetical protein|tara:strand:+ start:115 stop:2562 length:2448 start_codon:yes stop_codon:yes gene_type:complete